MNSFILVIVHYTTLLDICFRVESLSEVAPFFTHLLFRISQYIKLYAITDFPTQVNNLMETMRITVVDSVNNDLRGVNKPPKVLSRYKVMAPDGKSSVEVMETQSPPGAAGNGLEGKENSTDSGSGDTMVVEDALSTSRTSPVNVVDSTNNGTSDGVAARFPGRTVEPTGVKQKKAALTSTSGLELDSQLEVRDCALTVDPSCLLVWEVQRLLAVEKRTR